MHFDYQKFPKVTIGIPTYNNCETIGKTLDSVCKQNYPNLEIVVSNDCSTDSTSEVITSFIKSNNLIHVVDQPENLGLYENMRYLLANCNSPYFMWLAGDDHISPDFISNNLDFLEGNPDYVASSSFPSYLRNGLAQDGIPLVLNSNKEARIRNFLENPYSSHNVFYSLIRTEVGKGFPHLGARYAAADWVFDMFLISKGKINTSAKGFIFLGTNGVSRTPNANRKFRTTKIESLFPMWPMSRDIVTLSGFSLIEKMEILKFVTKINFTQFKSDLLRIKGDVKSRLAQFNIWKRHLGL